MGQVTDDVLARHLRVLSAEAVANGTAPVVTHQHALLSSKSWDQKTNYVLGVPRWPGGFLHAPLDFKKSVLGIFYKVLDAI